MGLEQSRKVYKETVDLAKGIIYGLGLTQNQTLKTISILHSLSSNNNLALDYATIFRSAAEELGLRISTYKNCNTSEALTLARNRLVTFNKPLSKESGFVRGLSHGFHRAITLPQIIESAIKADFCNEHIWFIESDFRIMEFKKAEALNIESKRLASALMSGIADKVGIIQGKEYSNDFYRKLVWSWTPDVYFINRSAGAEAIEEAKFRAHHIGAELVIMREIGRSHTTQFEKLERKLQRF